MRHLLPLVLLASAFMALETQAAKPDLSRGFNCALGQWGEEGSLKLYTTKQFAVVDGRETAMNVIEIGEGDLQLEFEGSHGTILVSLKLTTGQLRSTDEKLAYLAVPAEVRSSGKKTKATCFLSLD